MNRTADSPWWADAVVYQVYPRSFQDSDGDGLGDLPGVISRLDHLAWLGVDAVWLSPFYESPGADLGYDISGFCAVDPALGSMADVDELIARAHELGVRVLLDLVPSHTSIEHPWFREHPERYVWADDGPPNNWVSAFGGPAWSLDDRSGRWYLHSFYPEQPDLDWSQPEVREAMAEVVRFWTARGVDGFRVDAIDRIAKDPGLRDDPPASGDFGLPLPNEEYAALDHVHSTDGPGLGVALAALREAAGDALLVGEVYLPSDRLGRYLEHLDLAFSFELLHAPRDPAALARVIAGAYAAGGPAWMLSNHDFPRLAGRFGSRYAPALATMLLTLPGVAFVYQGDELGATDGEPADPPADRAGRDGYRTPMRWDSSPSGGFSEGTPWLPLSPDPRRNVESERRDPGSLLNLYRELIGLRGGLGEGLGEVRAEGGLLRYDRGLATVAVNLGDEAERFDPDGEPILWIGAGGRDRTLRPGDAAIARLAMV